MSHTTKPKTAAERLTELEALVGSLQEEVRTLQDRASLSNAYLLRMFAAQHSVIEALRRNNQPARNVHVRKFRDELTVLESEVKETS